MSGAASGATLGTRNSALLAGMVNVRISELAKFSRLMVQNKEETPQTSSLVEREFPQYR
jgi:hypothetical protein